MTLIEAIKSGKPFRRPSCPNYPDQYYTTVVNQENESCIFLNETGSKFILNQDDLLATDWEIKTRPEELWVNFNPDGTYAVYQKRNSAVIFRKRGAVTRRYILAFDGE